MRRRPNLPPGPSDRPNPLYGAPRALAGVNEGPRAGPEKPATDFRKFGPERLDVVAIIEEHLAVHRVVHLA
jgi:hypothetical protein